MKVQVIIGSTRPHRVSDRLAKWVLAEAKAMEGVEAELVDIRQYEMPFFDEPSSPQFNSQRTANPGAKKWLNKVAEADAYVLVTPEYNRSTSGALKNALDYIDFQFEKKPVALVGHGSTGGAQAISHLRGILPGLLAVTVPRATFVIGDVNNLIDEDGKLSEAITARPSGPHTSIKQVLDDLKWYSDALATARAR